MGLLIGSLGAFYLWTLLRYLLPWKLPDALALLTYGGLAFGVLFIPLPKVSLALACAGGLVFLHLIAASLLGASPRSLKTPGEFHLPVWRRASRTRVPGEAPSTIGRRIPKL